MMIWRGILEPAVAGSLKGADTKGPSWPPLIAGDGVLRNFLSEFFDKDIFSPFLSIFWPFFLPPLEGPLTDCHSSALLLCEQGPSLSGQNPKTNNWCLLHPHR